MKDLRYIGGHRHPKNRFGQGSKEFYDEEARLYGFKSPQEYAIEKEKRTPKCPHCGIAYGFNMGTGDCDCGE
jgi:hypothetical protein